MLFNTELDDATRRALDCQKGLLAPTTPQHYAFHRLPRSGKGQPKLVLPPPQQKPPEPKLVLPSQQQSSPSERIVTLSNDLEVDDVEVIVKLITTLRQEREAVGSSGTRIVLNTIRAVVTNVAVATRNGSS